MKITQEEVVERQTVLNIELDDEDLDSYLDRGYRRLVQRAVIPGFRRGKAPRRIIEHYMGREALLNEVLDTMLPEVTSKAIDAQSLDASGLPSIELLDLNPVTVKATVPLKPTVEVGDYRAMRVPYEQPQVSDEDVQKRLEEIRRGMASWEPVERPVQSGDMVTIAVTGKVEDETIIEDDDAVYVASEDNQRPFPGFAQQIIGMEIDQTKEFSLTVPEDFASETIAGKEAHFTVTLTDIKEQVLPELDDEFAKGIGEGYESLEDLKSKIKDELQKETEARTRQEYESAVMEKLLEGATFELPPVLIDHEAQHILEDRARTLAQFNIRLGDYMRSQGKTEDDLRDEVRDDAVNRLKRTFAVSKVAELEGIEVKDEDVDERIKSILEEVGREEGDPGKVDQGARESVRRMVLVERIMERLTAIARGEAPEAPPAKQDQADESQSQSKEEQTA